MNGKAKTIVEGGTFRADYNELVPDPVLADILFEETWRWFPEKAEEGRPVDGTDFLYKEIPDIPNGRILYVNYRITEKEIILWSVREGSMY